MKAKRLFTFFLAAMVVSILSFSQSASATTGFADSFPTAASVYSGSSVTGHIDSLTDYDFYDIIGYAPNQTIAVLSPFSTNVNAIFYASFNGGPLVYIGAFPDGGVGGADIITIGTGGISRLVVGIYDPANPGPSSGYYTLITHPAS